MAPNVYLEIYAAVEYLKLSFRFHLPGSEFLKQLFPSSENNQGESHLIVFLTSPTPITVTKEPYSREFIPTNSGSDQTWKVFVKLRWFVSGKK